MNEDQKVVPTSLDLNPLDLNPLDWNRSSSMDWKQSLDERERERSFKNGMIAKFLLSDEDEEDLVVFLSLILFVVPESENEIANKTRFFHCIGG